MERKVMGEVFGKQKRLKEETPEVTEEVNNEATEEVKEAE